MADTVPITAGSGTVIGTDEVTIGGAPQHVQRVKLVDGTDGGTGLIAGDATNGLDVDVTRDLSTDTSATGNITAANSNLTSGAATANSTVGPLALSGRQGVAVLLTGTWSAQLQVQVSVDNSNWTQVYIAVPTTHAPQSVIIANGLYYIVGGAAATHVRVTASAYTSGTAAATVVGVASAPLLTAVDGNQAHGTADSGQPMKTGARVLASLDDMTLLSAGNRADALCDVDAVSYTKLYCPFSDIVSERVTDTGGTSTAFTNFGATANVRNMLTTLSVYNDSTTSGFLDLRDGTAGTVLFTVPLPAKGGAVVQFPVPLRQPTANTVLAYDVSAALTTVYISVIGFRTKA